MRKARCLTFGPAHLVGLVAVAIVAAGQGFAAQGRQDVQPNAKPAAIEKLGPTQYRLGQVHVDTASREVSVTGKVNPNVQTLEFVANTRDGWRTYESALSLDTDAITFNAALVLIGLDGSHATGVPRVHFDRTAVSGDVVNVTLECPGGECQRMPAERVMYDREKKEAVSGGKWIYTGSSFTPDNRYLADIGAVLIGFVHDPATVIEYSVGAGLGHYGQIVTNPTIGLAPDVAIKITVKAAPR
jgi:hypothetical protein